VPDGIIDGKQWFSALVPATRPDHAALHEKIFRKGADGGYTGDDGQPMPPIPWGPNCLCWDSPVLADDLTAGLPPENLGAWYDDSVLRAEKERGAGVKRKAKKAVSKPKAKSTPKKAGKAVPKSKATTKPTRKTTSELQNKLDEMREKNALAAKRLKDARANNEAAKSELAKLRSRDAEKKREIADLKRRIDAANAKTKAIEKKLRAQDIASDR